jgi:hypothetical protein
VTGQVEGMSTIAVVMVDMLNPYDHKDGDFPGKNVKKIVTPLMDLVGKHARPRTSSWSSSMTITAISRRLGRTWSGVR